MPIDPNESMPNTENQSSTILGIYGAINIVFALFMLIFLVFGLSNAIENKVLQYIKILAFFFAGAMLLHNIYFSGLKHAACLFVSATVLGFLAETLASKSGILGWYQYSSFMGLSIYHIPLVIPLLWYAFSYSIQNITSCLLNNPFGDSSLSLSIKAVYVFLGAMLLVGWDLVLDPYFVSIGAWTWKTKGPVFGIPIENFIGWFIVSFVILSVFWTASNLKTERKIKVRRKLLFSAPVFVYSYFAIGALLYYAFNGNIQLCVICLCVMCIPATICLFRLSGMLKT